MAKGKISAEPQEPQAGLTRRRSGESKLVEKVRLAAEEVVNEHVKMLGLDTLQLAEGLEARFTDDGFEINSFLAASREEILNFKYGHGGIANSYSSMNARLTIKGRSAGSPTVEIQGVYSGQDLNVWLVKDGTGQVLAKYPQGHAAHDPAIDQKYISLAREAAEKAVKELQVRKVYDAFMARQESKQQTPMKTLQNYVGKPDSSESGHLPLRAR